MRRSSPATQRSTELGLRLPETHRRNHADLRRAERQGRKDYRVRLAEDGTTAWIKAEMSLCAESSALVSAQLEDLLAPLDKAIAADSQRIRQISSSRTDPPQPAPGPGDTLSRFRHGRALRTYRKLETEQQHEMKMLPARMTANLEQRRYLHDQARDLLMHIAATSQARIASYRRGLEKGPWWSRLFRRPRQERVPVPCVSPVVGWYDGDFPLLRTEVSETSEVLTWQWEQFREPGPSTSSP